MELYVSEFSKYVIALLITLYTYECFAVFRYDNEERRNGIYLRQNILMFVLHFCCFLVICFETGDFLYLFFFAFQQLLLFAAIVLFRMLYPKGNILVMNNMCMLLSIGFIILTRLDVSKAKKQFVIVAFSLSISLVIPYLLKKLRFLRSLKWIYAIIGIAALSVVLILGQTTYGSKLSYSVLGVTFQPSEFVKIIFVFFVAAALYRSSGFWKIAVSAVIAAAHVLILVASKDLGSALIFFVVYVLMVYVSSKNPLYLLAGAGGGAVAAFGAWKIFRHVQVRVQAWKDPWSVIDSAGYQITQSLFAISSGGWFGLGLFQGTPESIPTVEADFIYSAVAEELGIIFAVCLILICVSCFIMFMNISVRLNDRFYQLVAFGLGVTYIFQVFLTIGGGTKFIPLTGVTLPFISYGGSSVLTTLIMFFLIEGLYIIRQEELEELERMQRRRQQQRRRKRKPSGRKRRQRAIEEEWNDGEQFDEERQEDDEWELYEDWNEEDETE